MAKELLTVLRLDDAQFRRGMSDNQKAVLGFSGAVIGVAASFAAIAKSTADYEDETGKAAKAAGLTTERFSELRHIAGLADVDIGLLGKSMRKLLDPTKETEASLKRFGVNLRDSNGRMRDQSDILSDISKRYKEIQDPAEKARLTVEAFGEKGSAMASLLDSDIEALTEQAHRMGAVVSTEAAVAAEKFNDDLTVLHGSVSGLSRAVGDSVIQFANQSGIIESISSGIQDVTKWYKELDEDQKQIVLTAGAMVAAVAAVAAGLVILGSVLPFVVASFTAATAVLAANPFAVAIVGVVALGIALASLREDNDDVIESIREHNDALRDSETIYKSLQGKAQLTTAETRKLADADRALEAAAKAAGVAIDIETMSLEDKRKKLEEVRNAQRAQLASQLIQLNDSIEAAERNRDQIERSAGNFAGVDFKSMTRAQAAVKGLAQEYDQYAQAARAVQRLHYTHATALKELNRSYDSATPAVQGFTRAIGEQGTAMEFAVPRGPQGEIRKFTESVYKGSESVDKFFATLKNGSDKAATGVSTFEALSESAGDFAGAISEVAGQAGQALGAISGVMQQVASVQAAQIERTTEKRLYDLDIISNVMERQAEEEIARVEKLENERLETLRASQAAQLGILQQGMVERLRLIDQQFATEEQKREAAYQRQLEEERIKWMADTAAFLAATRSKEERRIIQEEQDQAWNEREAQLEAEHKTYMAEFAAGWGADKQAATEEENKKLQEAKVASDLAIEKAEQEKNAKLKALQDQRQADEKAAAKFKTFLEWAGQSAAMETQKGAQIAQVVASTAAGAAQAFAATAWIPFVGPVIGAALAGTIMAYGARSVQMIRTQRVPPPVSLMFARGGVTKGPSHAAGGMDTMIGNNPANVEGSEAVIDRERTSRLFGFIDNLTSGRQMAQRGPTTVNLHFYGVRNATPAFAREVMDIAKREIDSEAVA